MTDKEVAVFTSDVKYIPIDNKGLTRGGVCYICGTRIVLGPAGSDCRCDVCKKRERR